MTDAKFKLEDILNKKKAPPQILDLANIKIESEEDFRAVIEKIPDYRIQPERDKDVQNFIDNLKMAQENAPDFPEDQVEGLKEKPMSAKKSLLFVPQPAYQFADPCPESMRGVKISDLSSVDINWKMLTLARPNNKTDEEIFSKLVQLDKLRLQTRAKEAEQALARGGKDPFIVVKNPSASKGGVAEKSIKTCSECAEEFCSGTCKEFQYDAYQRLVLPEKEVEITGNEVQSSKKKGKKKRKKRKKSSGTKKVSHMPVTDEEED
ncbi:uncharacterized protein LOC131877682 isoform X2 [Tigriopus californicus]|uniref:uncharacterized protein LOC131877682 isoform X2 n=1 Tax=Tigriopus californicus TaxID=6832 RepID=UPI0027DA9198|nr:uncharacterized protein LOC131877682 isoform X2 [Tigriopus californicus]